MNTFNFEWRFCSSVPPSLLLKLPFANRKYEELSYPQKIRKCATPFLAWLVTLLKMRPHPVAHPHWPLIRKYPPPLPGNKEECQMMFKHRLPLCHQRGILLCLLYVLVSLSLNVLLRYLDNKITCFFVFNRSAIYANRNVLSLYHKTHPDLLAQNGKEQPHIIGITWAFPSFVKAKFVKMM